MKNQLILVVLDNGDEGVVLNGSFIYTIDRDEEGTSALDLAENLSRNLQTPVVRVDLPVPDDEAWSYDDLLSQISIELAKSQSTHHLTLGSATQLEMTSTDESVKLSINPIEGDLDNTIDCEIKLGNQYGASEGTVKIPLIEVDFDEDNPGIVIQRVSDRLEIWTNEAYRADKLATLGFNPDGSLYFETPRPPILDAF